MSEQIVTLRNTAGHALHCILESPASGVVRRDVACVLLSPGVKMRVAPHRLYRKVAQEFLSRGIAVLRVDFHGLGDSEGELPEAQLDQLYREVQLGRHVDDVHAALEFVAKQLGVQRFVVGGLCGGALTGLLTAPRDPRIVGLYAIGIPVILDGTGQHAAANMTHGQLDSLRTRYLQKLLQPQAWLRLLSFRTDFRLMLRSVFKVFRGGGGRGAKAQAEGVPPPVAPLAANLNMSFVRAFFHLIAQRTPMLLVFSGADRLHFEYQEKVLGPWGPALERAASKPTLAVVPQANHILGDPAWVQQSRKVTGEWLDLHFPATR
jgi:pimeloyl-ACP methyl ester carboxylesterase